METVQWKGDINARCKVEEIKWYFVIGAPGLVQPVTTCLNLGCWGLVIAQNKLFVCVCVPLLYMRLCLHSFIVSARSVHASISIQTYPSLSITPLTHAPPLILSSAWLQSFTCAASIPRLWTSPVERKHKGLHPDWHFPGIWPIDMATGSPH